MGNRHASHPCKLFLLLYVVICVGASSPELETSAKEDVILNSLHDEKPSASTSCPLTSAIKEKEPSCERDDAGSEGKAQVKFKAEGSDMSFGTKAPSEPRDWVMTRSELQSDLSKLKNLILNQKQTIHSLNAQLQLQFNLINDIEHRLSRLYFQTTRTEEEVSSELKSKQDEGYHLPYSVDKDEKTSSYGMQEDNGLSTNKETKRIGNVFSPTKSSWNAYFSLLFASKLRNEISSVLVVSNDDNKNSNTNNNENVLCQYIIIGDVTGKISILSPSGELMQEYSTLTNASVTSTLAIHVRKNETWLISGHSDGSVLMHSISKTQVSDSARQNAMEDDHTSIPPVVKHLKTFSLSPSHSNSNQDFQASQSDDDDTSEHYSNQKITHIELYRSSNSKYILTANSAGKIQLYRTNGSLYGSVLTQHPPLAFLRSSSAHRMLFLTSNGVSSLDLKSMTVHASECFGLNGSEIVDFVFDSVARSRAYGITSDRKIVYVVLSGDVIRINCQVRMRLSSLIDGVVTPVAIRGHLLIVSQNEIGVWNTTAQKENLFGSSPKSIGPKSSFIESMADISSIFDHSHLSMHSPPIVASNRDRLIAIAFKNGYISVFKSNQVIKKSNNHGIKIWSTPVLFLCLLLTILWQIFNKRQNLQTSEPTFSFPFPPQPEGPAFRKPEAGFQENLQTEPGVLGRRLRHLSKDSHSFSDVFEREGLKKDIIQFNSLDEKTFLEYMEDNADFSDLN